MLLTVSPLKGGLDFQVSTWKRNGNFCPKEYREAPGASERKGRREVAVWERKKKMNCCPALVGKMRNL